MPDIFLLIPTAVSVLRLFCKNRWNKRNCPKTSVSNGTCGHERIIVETRNQLPYDGRNSATYQYTPGGEGLKATPNQIRELWFDIAHMSVITVSGLPFVLISTPVSVLSFFCTNRWNKRNTPKTVVQNVTRPHEKVSNNVAELGTHDKPTRKIISWSKFCPN